MCIDHSIISFCSLLSAPDLLALSLLLQSLHADRHTHTHGVVHRFVPGFRCSLFLSRSYGRHSWTMRDDEASIQTDFFIHLPMYMHIRAYSSLAICIHVLDQTLRERRSCIQHIDRLVERLAFLPFHLLHYKLFR